MHYTDRLETLSQRFDEIEASLANPGGSFDQAKFTALMKERAAIEETVVDRGGALDEKLARRNEEFATLIASSLDSTDARASDPSRRFVPVAPDTPEETGTEIFAFGIFNDSPRRRALVLRCGSGALAHSI